MQCLTGHVFAVGPDDTGESVSESLTKKKKSNIKNKHHRSGKKKKIGYEFFCNSRLVVHVLEYFPGSTLHDAVRKQTTAKLGVYWIVAGPLAEKSILKASRFRISFYCMYG